MKYLICICILMMTFISCGKKSKERSFDVTLHAVATADLSEKKTIAYSFDLFNIKNDIQYKKVSIGKDHDLTLDCESTITAKNISLSVKDNGTALLFEDFRTILSVKAVHPFKEGPFGQWTNIEKIDVKTEKCHLSRSLVYELTQEGKLLYHNYCSYSCHWKEK